MTKNIFIIFIITVLTILFLCTLHSNQSQETSSLPVSNHVIILDAGHGLPDSGATSNYPSKTEEELNLIICQKIQKLLETSNCTVILTRSDNSSIYSCDDDQSINEKKKSDMNNRVDISKDSNAEIFVSIHMNKLSNPKYYGYQTFYKNKDNDSKKLAQSIQNSLNNYITLEKTRKIKSISGIYLTKKVKLPLIIVECGFLSNESETILLNQDEYQSKLAWGIYIGIMDYLN